MMKQIILGSRESKLAVVQAEMVQRALQALHPDYDFPIKTYKTTGDKILDRTLDKVGGKGLFTKELEAALLCGEVDLLVHSFKDVPMEVNPDIPIVGVSAREDPADVLVLPQGKTQMDPSLPIGCSSFRRTLQLKQLFPGFTVKPVRGNLQTRLKKLDEGQFGALCLAAAGLYRLNLEERVYRKLTVEEMLPAVCQGVLALQARKDFDCSVLEGFADPVVQAISVCERSFARALDGGCSSPVAAHATVADGQITLRGLYVEPDNETMHFDTATGTLAQAETLGASLALSMKKRWENGTD